eukprot:scaffold320315_cov37-Tisochrysis_lutea.AAC.1
MVSRAALAVGGLWLAILLPERVGWKTINIHQTQQVSNGLENVLAVATTRSESATVIIHEV